MLTGIVFGKNISFFSEISFSLSDYATVLLINCNMNAEYPYCYKFLVTIKGSYTNLIQHPSNCGHI